MSATVYLAQTYEDYETPSIIGIFSTLEAAKTWAHAAMLADQFADGCVVKGWVLDERRLTERHSMERGKEWEESQP